jgi:hypothetical protein
MKNNMRKSLQKVINKDKSLGIMILRRRVLKKRKKIKKNCIMMRFWLHLRSIKFKKMSNNPPHWLLLPLTNVILSNHPQTLSDSSKKIPQHCNKKIRNNQAINLKNKKRKTEQNQMKRYRIVMTRKWRANIIIKINNLKIKESRKQNRRNRIKMKIFNNKKI